MGLKVDSFSCSFPSYQIEKRNSQKRFKIYKVERHKASVVYLRKCFEVQNDSFGLVSQVRIENRLVKLLTHQIRIDNKIFFF